MQKDSGMVEHSRIIRINVSVTAVVHRTGLQWQWDRSDKLTAPPSPELTVKAGEGSLYMVVSVVSTARSSLCDNSFSF